MYIYSKHLTEKWKDVQFSKILTQVLTYQIQIYPASVNVNPEKAFIGKHYFYCTRISVWEVRN